MSDVPERLREGCIWGFPHLDFWEPLWNPTFTKTCWARPLDAILEMSGKCFVLVFVTCRFEDVRIIRIFPLVREK
ncbi:hypothetical protein TNIN_458491 [Trichonephila inaurata madagascariensis]|uniref:Uncharacterized protein n=1 Tax=Trichonephila inaurata madagascariensis TaxID=2747483 RepID=A0A8X6MES1_9ARAC|nr:hypothetical protein TNIN_458491 [Trichonephila inaurata madagascariensis]